ncbi:MAG: GFA family protein [Stappiaceae bacterium]
MSKITGSCLCGSVKYSTDADPAMIAVCHCPDCQKQTGTAFSVNVLVPNDQIEMSGNSLTQYVVKGASGEEVTRNFCNKCGSPLSTYMPAFSHLAALKAGTMDDNSWVEPGIQIWCENAQDWGVLNDEIQKTPKNPG